MVQRLGKSKKKDKGGLVPDTKKGIRDDLLQKLEHRGVVGEGGVPGRKDGIAFLNSGGRDEA